MLHACAILYVHNFYVTESHYREINAKFHDKAIQLTYKLAWYKQVNITTLWYSLLHVMQYNEKRMEKIKVFEG